MKEDRIKKDDKEKWFPIIGFSDYEINSEGRIRSCKSGSWVLLKRNTAAKLSKDGQVYRFTVRNVLLAVNHNISPEQIKGICFVPDKNGGQYVTREDCSKIMVQRSACSRALNQEKIYKDLERAEHFIKLIYEYYKTGDIHDVACFINSLEQEIISYIFKNQYTRCMDTAKEYWGEVIEVVLSGIKGHSISIIEPLGYLKIISRNIIAKRRREKRMIKSYDENNNLMGTYY